MQRLQPLRPQRLKPTALTNRGLGGLGPNPPNVPVGSDLWVPLDRTPAIGDIGAAAGCLAVICHRL